MKHFFLEAICCVCLINGSVGSKGWAFLRRKRSIPVSLFFVSVRDSDIIHLLGQTESDKLLGWKRLNWLRLRFGSSDDFAETYWMAQRIGRAPTVFKANRFVFLDTKMAKNCAPRAWTNVEI